MIEKKTEAEKQVESQITMTREELKELWKRGNQPQEKDMGFVGGINTWETTQSTSVWGLRG